MASGFCSYWIPLLTLVLTLVLSSSPSTRPPQYVLHRTRLSFDRASDACSPGVLASLATEQEVADVLRLVSGSMSPQNHFTFWVGLKKDKNQCVVPSLPLRGFRWTEDDSEESQVSRWSKEPQDTCTTVRCAALQGRVHGPVVHTWGLVPLTCRDTSVHQFICKLRDRGIRPATEEPVTAGRGPAAPEPSKPGPGQSAPEPSKPESGPAAPPQPDPELTVGGPELETGLKPELQGPDSGWDSGLDSGTSLVPDSGRDSGLDSGPSLGPESVPGSGLGVGSDLCKRPSIPGTRYLRPDPDDSTRVQVECWSTVQLELVCRGRPASWRLPDDSLANFTSVCQLCSDGFTKDASANCVDTDECSSAPCRRTCLNTEGSFRCVCSDGDGNLHDEGSAACSLTVAVNDGVLVPVLVAVAALVVLVVVVAVTVKCCLMRRKKRRAGKKSEKMAMKDSFAATNEKTAT